MRVPKIALFPGSFDPYTNGHQDIVSRAALLFDQVIIAIGNNTSKKRYFPLEDTLHNIAYAVRGLPNVSVEAYDTLTSDFARIKGASYLIRGLRNTTDFEYENGIAQANRFLNPELETVFLITDPTFAHVSSSILREMHRFGVDISKLVPYYSEKK